MEKSTIRLLVLVVFYIIYLLIGAAIFSAIEYKNEQNLINDLKQKRAQFLSKNQACINDTELEAFITRIIEANSRGISAISNLTVEPNWSFGQAVFFAGTVLTTIGYGNFFNRKIYQNNHLILIQMLIIVKVMFHRCQMVEKCFVYFMQYLAYH